MTSEGRHLSKVFRWLFGGPARGMLYCIVSAGTLCYTLKMSSGHLFIYCVCVCVCVCVCMLPSEEKCLVTSLHLKTLVPYDYPCVTPAEAETEQGGGSKVRESERKGEFSREPPSFSAFERQTLSYSDSHHWPPSDPPPASSQSQSWGVIASVRRHVARVGISRWPRPHTPWCPVKKKNHCTATVTFVPLPLSKFHVKSASAV